MPNSTAFENPFRPGAGHQPPYLAGRDREQAEIKRILTQTVVTENVILTGLRGVGKTVLLETFKPIAYENNWLWTGTDFSESTSVSEETIAKRIITDLAIITSPYVISEQSTTPIGFLTETKISRTNANYETLIHIYERTPGLVSDKLKFIFELSWVLIKNQNEAIKGIVFAYDEAQNIEDHAPQGQYPLSLLLEVFQSIQRKNIPFILIFTGLPTLFPKLVDARTYAERMFHVIFLNQLDRDASREAILKPIERDKCKFRLKDEDVDRIIDFSCGYPYFIQYICKEIFDAWLQKIMQKEPPTALYDDIIRKLDIDFFQGRWLNLTDRQRELLKVISILEHCDNEFTVQEIATKSKDVLEKSFSPSHTNQMLASLANKGLVFKNRFGKYSLAVPLLSQFIRRQDI